MPRKPKIDRVAAAAAGSVDPADYGMDLDTVLGLTGFGPGMLDPELHGLVAHWRDRKTEGTSAMGPAFSDIPRTGPSA